MDEKILPNEHGPKSLLKNNHVKDDSLDKSHKTVSFADSLGQNLVEIRNYAPSNESLQLQGSTESLLLKTSTLSSMGKDLPHDIKWISYFKDLDSASQSYFELVKQRKVVLEKLSITEHEQSGSQMLTGLIRVSNIAFKKNVFIRGSYNNWTTHFEVPALFEHHSEHTNSDIFTFSFNLQKDLSLYLSVMEFAAAYQVENETHWDNNKGCNYKIYHI